MLKVYFTAATSYDGDLKGNHRKIIEIIEKNSAELISGRQIIDEFLLKEDKTRTREQIFLREKKHIDEADCIIAEVTKPSLGVGTEIEYALNRQKPVLALVHKENEDRLSPMLAGNPAENLFIEHYDFENAHFVIQEFLNHVSLVKKKKGKLIVVDGGDGSGKTTQVNLLVKFLKTKKIPVKYMDFPRYYNSFHGRTVGRFLRGEFGSIDEVSPYLASLAYALDRAAVKKEMDEYLQKGGYIIANRYATSNMAHQGAKFTDEKQREKYLKWVYELEYKVHKIPREDVVIYLYVPWKIGLDLTQNKPAREYLHGKQDIHEEDIKYRKEVEKLYLHLSSVNDHWFKINCVQNSKLLTPEIIHNQIVKILKEKNIIA